MKKVISGVELEAKMEESIQLLCDTVKQTLGPIGKNAIIDHSSYSPFITNDGVTIAKNIESEDEVMGAILEIAKEASIKTNEVVGDGTTTTLVLLQSLFLESRKSIKKGIHPVILKKELEKTLEIILNLLQDKIIKPTEIRIKDMAISSANDKTLGTIAYEVLKKVKSPLAVSIQEIPENTIDVTYLKGYCFSSHLASYHFLAQNQELILQDAFLLLIHDTLQDLNSISFFINEVCQKKKAFVILATEFDDLIVQEILALSKQENLSCALIKILEYGLKTNQIMKDIEVISNAKMINDLNDFSNVLIGKVKSVTIDKDQTKIDFNMDSHIKKYIQKMKKEAKKIQAEFDESFYQKRIAMFTHGIAEIKLGAPTKIECLEKRMRLEDALCATAVSKKGLLPGSGISLLQIEQMLESNQESFQIWKKALKKPWEQILLNAGIDYSKKEERLKKENYQMIYNLITEKWETIDETKVVDPYFVVANALMNACSIAGMLLTTTSLIINEYKSSPFKEKEYTEW